MPRGAKPGHPKYGGRKKGTPNKITQSCREVVWQVWEGLGGVEAMQEWGKANPSQFYASIWGRFIPGESMKATIEPGEGGKKVTVTFGPFSSE